MRANKLREAWDAGKGTVNGWLSIPSSFSAEVMSHQGWDSLTIDCQHGLIDYQTAVTMLQAISTTNTVPLIRVPWREPGIIMKSLDAGAYGIICPMVNTVEQAKEFVGFASYPPKGERSFGPIRALIYGGADYPKHANETVLKIAMIETKQALENVEAICAVDGLDGIYIGPADLANSLGAPPGFDPTDERVLEAISTILEAAKKAGIYAGIHCGMPKFAKRMLNNGFNYVTIMSDARLLAMQSQAMLAEMGETDGGTQSSSY